MDTQFKATIKNNKKLMNILQFLSTYNNEITIRFFDMGISMDYIDDNKTHYKFAIPKKVCDTYEYDQELLFSCSLKEVQKAFRNNIIIQVINDSIVIGNKKIPSTKLDLDKSILVKDNSFTISVDSSRANLLKYHQKVTRSGVIGLHQDQIYKGVLGIIDRPTQIYLINLPSLR